MSKSRVRIYLSLLAVTIIWGIASPIIKYTLGWFDPWIFLSYRFLISASIALLTIVVFGIKIPRDPRILFWAVVYAFLTSTVGLGILFLGFDKTSAIDASLIGATAPLFIAISGVVFLKEHLTKRELFGISIAFLGTGITILEPFLKGHNGSSLTGNLLVLVSVLVGVASAVLAKKVIRENVRPIDLTNITFIVGFLTIIPIALMTHTGSQIISQVTSAPLGFHLGVIYMAIISGTLAYYWWARATKSIEIGEIGVFGYLYPIFATPLAVIWLGEKISIPFIVGGVIIAIGVFIAEFKKRA